MKLYFFVNIVYIGGIKVNEKIDIMNDVAKEMESSNLDGDNV